MLKTIPVVDIPSTICSRADMNREGYIVLATPLSTMHSIIICKGFLHFGSAVILVAVGPEKHGVGSQHEARGPTSLGATEWPGDQGLTTNQLLNFTPKVGHALVIECLDDLQETSQNAQSFIQR